MADDEVPIRCQARPKAARPGYRTDMLCASFAKTTVPFCGREIAVCRMHEASYERWGTEAEGHAAERWGWVELHARVTERAPIYAQLANSVTRVRS